MKTILMIFFLLLTFTACSPRPQTAPTSPSKEGVDPIKNSQQPQEKTEASALWVVTSDNQFGNLGRLDLKTGKFQPYLLATSPDAKILPDGPQGKDGLFLLNRLENDSVQMIRKTTAEVVAELPLPSGANPQYVLRDGQQRVWITSMNSSEVDVYSSQLEKKIQSINLSHLKDSQDNYPELSNLILLNNQTLAVSALRLRRNFQGGPNWVPEEKSGLALIDLEQLQLKADFLIPVANPLDLFLLPNGNLSMVGSGDLSPLHLIKSKSANLNFTSPSLTEFQLSEVKEESSIILDSSLSSSGLLAKILWNSSKKTSCLTYGTKTLLCQSDEDQGNMFETLLVIGQLVYVSYYDKNGVYELWVVSLNGSESSPLKKISMDQRILDLSPGP